MYYSIVIILLFIKSSSFAPNDSRRHLSYLTFNVLYPKGYLMSIPHQSAIENVGFHSNLNKPIQCDFNVSWNVIDRWGGRWSYMDRKAKLKVGDVVYFCLDLKKNGVLFRYKGKAIATILSSSSEEVDDSRYEEEERQLMLAWSHSWIQEHTEFIETNITK